MLVFPLHRLFHFFLNSRDKLLNSNHNFNTLWLFETMFSNSLSKSFASKLNWSNCSIWRVTHSDNCCKILLTKPLTIYTGKLHWMRRRDLVCLLMIGASTFVKLSQLSPSICRSASGWRSLILRHVENTLRVGQYIFIPHSWGSSPNPPSGTAYSISSLT